MLLARETGAVTCELGTRPDMVNGNIAREFFLFARASKRRREGERERAHMEPTSK